MIRTSVEALHSLFTFIHYKIQYIKTVIDHIAQFMQYLSSLLTTFHYLANTMFYREFTYSSELFGHVNFLSCNNCLLFLTRLFWDFLVSTKSGNFFKVEDDDALRISL